MVNRGNANIDLPHDDLLHFCERWQVESLALFGSVLRSDFDAHSDIDVLVSFLPDNGVDLFDLVDMKNELEDLFKRPVDLVEREALTNPYRRREILAHNKVIYAA
ncbi:MAG: nucleotidyltransferase family protein [Spirochaeta sp.]|nr:nucleotidyltransferase family protein [Spirochaeta sp.]